MCGMRKGISMESTSADRARSQSIIGSQQPAEAIRRTTRSFSISASLKAHLANNTARLSKKTAHVGAVYSRD